jgi:peptidoglycan glycosyltransferase
MYYQSSKKRILKSQHIRKHSSGSFLPKALSSLLAVLLVGCTSVFLFLSPSSKTSLGTDKKDIPAEKLANEKLAEARFALKSNKQDNEPEEKTEVTGKKKERSSDSNTFKVAISKPEILQDLNKAKLSQKEDLTLLTRSLPKQSSRFKEKLAALTPEKNLIFYTLDPALQHYAEQIVSETNAPHAALVAIDPFSGKILALAEKSISLENAAFHAGFPAASLFKLITASAAIEKGAINPYSNIRYRGGTYTLNSWNYKPSKRSDRRVMSLSEAMGKSCNPVFARIAMEHLQPRTLRRYAEAFGFNQKLPFDIPLQPSSAKISSKAYPYSRAAAGFGDVHLTPVHAASIISGITNGGVLLQPGLVDKIVKPDGTILHRFEPRVLRRMIKPETAEALAITMRHTITRGTSKREFMRGSRPLISGAKIIGKTGTLRGHNPEGLNNWFIGAMTGKAKPIAVATLVVYPYSVSTRASRLARKLFQRHLQNSEVTRS